MFFPERILSIKSTDRVLEIGPGATPYFRSDVFLEKIYDTEKELIAQSGHVGKLITDKKLITYTGDIFPFKDNEFDYVICSHVLEHVENADLFLSEVQRVGKSGYLEFPNIYYDYIYNFPEHTLFLYKKNDVINWMKKSDSNLSDFTDVQKFFYRTCWLGYYETIEQFKQYFFQGFEWENSIESFHTSDFKDLTYELSEIKLPSKLDQQIPQIQYGNISLKEHLKYKLKRILTK